MLSLSLVSRSFVSPSLAVTNYLLLKEVHERGKRVGARDESMELIWWNASSVTSEGRKSFSVPSFIVLFLFSFIYNLSLRPFRASHVSSRNTPKWRLMKGKGRDLETCNRSPSQPTGMRCEESQLSSLSFLYAVPGIPSLSLYHVPFLYLGRGKRRVAIPSHCLTVPSNLM